MNNFSMLVRGVDGSTVSDDFDCCADLIMWYVGCTERRVVEAEIMVVSDDGRKIAISIPNSQSKKVRVRVQPEETRNYCCAF